MPIPSEVDVAIVGAGPAGLTAACTLRKKGVNAIVLDSASKPSTASRATVIHSRTLEVLENLELTETIMKIGDILTGWNICSQNSVLVDLDFSTLQAKYPMVVTLAQSETEALLRRRLEELGGAVYQSAQVTGVTDSGDKVQLEVNTSDTKTTVTAAYVVAADGLKSTIRESLGIAFEGGEYNASFVTADCRLSSIGTLRKDAVQLYLAPGGFLLFVPEPHGIWRIIATMNQAPKNADVALYQRLVDERAPGGVKVEELTWTSRFHIHHRLASHYRKGRCFLAGDASHVHSPAGGQGMNIGIQDGAMLGHILSEAVKEGKTSEVDLDRYERARRPVAQGVIGLTHRITLIATLQSPLLGTIRNWIMWAVMSIPSMRAWLTFKIAQLEH